MGTAGAPGDGALVADGMTEAAQDTRLQTQDTAPLSAGMTGGKALCRIVCACGADFAVHLAQMMENDAPEGPHRARVALRRLRSALRGFSPIIDKKLRKATEKQARDLFRLIGHVRDADVMLHDLPGGDGMQTRRAEADRRRAEVRAELQRASADAFCDTLRTRFSGGDWQAEGARARAWRKGKVARLARRAMRHAWSDSAAHGADLARMPQRDRHELRKDLKTLRYLAEFFVPLWPGDAQDAFLDRMRGLQDALGALNDLSLLDGGAPGAQPPPADQMRQLLKTAQKDWRALRDTKPYWG